MLLRESNRLTPMHSGWRSQRSMPWTPRYGVPTPMISLSLSLSLSVSLCLSIARALGRSDTHAKKKDAQGCAQVAVVRAEAGERASVGMASCDTHKHTHTKHTQKNTHKQTHTHTHTRRTDLVARRECAWPGRRCHQQHSQGESLS